jgi:hypothetical protein
VPGEAQQFVLKGLDELACLRHEPREELVAHMAEQGAAGAKLLGGIERWLGG